MASVAASTTLAVDHSVENTERMVMAAYPALFSPSRIFMSYESKARGIDDDSVKIVSGNTL